MKNIDTIQEYSLNTDLGEISINATPNMDYDKLVIPVHGAWGSKDAWNALAEDAMENGVKLVYPDLFGHNKSSDIPRNRLYSGAIKIADQVYAVQKLREDVAEKEKVDPKKIVLLGHSMGAFIVHKILEKPEDETERAILLAPPPIMGVLQATIDYVIKYFPQSINNFIKSFATFNLENLVKNDDLAREFLFSDKVPNMENLQHVKGFESLMSFLGMSILEWRDINAVQSKVEKGLLDLHVLIGKEDNVFPEEDQINYAKRLSVPESNIRIYPGLPHYLTISQQVREEILNIAKA